VPTYEYECEKCYRVYEVWQKISAAPLTACQHCGGAVHRLLAAAPFILKGRGWYTTDYPSESRKKAMEAEKKAGTPAEATSGNKSTDDGKTSTPKSDSTSKADTSTPSSGGSSSTSTSS
jgi:putative FmdB family regulatory protein